ncbi:hypothetical protein OEZ85_009367 [Tetradesmus obliquus]|uniref:Uncharacterized protein n=1 Tax=Tetradesmus obliquus TaxID=3088 RepID=A0ABY8UBW6_TETOB|nr:hypothetical protein OEZ85_009367 [Tetradesmus obliquus]
MLYSGRPSWPRTGNPLANLPANKQHPPANQQAIACKDSCRTAQLAPRWSWLVSCLAQQLQESSQQQRTWPKSSSSSSSSSSCK